MLCLLSVFVTEDVSPEGEARPLGPKPSGLVAQSGFGEVGPDGRQWANCGKSIMPKATNRRRYFTQAELSKLIAAARKGRYGQRDATLVLLMARHGLRVSEAVDLEWVSKMIAVAGERAGLPYQTHSPLQRA